MKQFRNVCAGIIVLIFAMGFKNSNDWYLFDSGEFSLRFPKQPVTSSQNLSSDVGDLTMNMFMYNASKDESDNLLYMLATTEYPDSLINSNDTEIVPDFFRSFTDGSVNSSEGTLLSEKIIELNGFPGREIKINIERVNAIVMMRAYLVYNKMIITQTITSKEKNDNSDILKFHDSLKLRSE